jgi:hypothetical protein
MRIGIALAGLALGLGGAHAGPYCGGTSGFGEWAIPPGSKLPRHPTIALVAEDSSTLQRHGSKEHPSGFSRIAATLNGKPVRLRIRDVRASHATVRLVEVVSSTAGSLRLFYPDAPDAPQLGIDYAIVDDARSPAVTAASSRFHTIKTRMMTIDRDGLALAFDAPALIAHVIWRKPDAGWQSLVVPIISRPTGRAEAWIGETDCWPEEIPLGMLESGIDMKITLELPDRSEQHLDLGRVSIGPRVRSP